MRSQVFTEAHLIEVAIEVQSRGDRPRLISILKPFEHADPNFSTKIDEESGQIVLCGTSDAQLDDIVSTLRHAHGLFLTVGAPQVAYREKLTCRVEQDTTHKEQAGGTGQFARVKIVFEPNRPGAGNVFESRMVAGAMPAAYIHGVEQGLNLVFRSGVRAGFPLLDTKATLINGAFHAADSSAQAFEVAARTAFRVALQKGSMLLEPIMHVEVVAPHDYAGSITGDFKSRRATLLGSARTGGTVTVTALVPLAHMFGYADQLRSFTAGSGFFAMRFERYEPVPPGRGNEPPPAAAVALRA